MIENIITGVIIFVTIVIAMLVGEHKNHRHHHDR